MKNIFICLVILVLSVMLIDQFTIASGLREEVEQLRVLKIHFYDFRDRVINNIPIDCLSAVNLDDFKFKGLEQ